MRAGTPTLIHESAPKMSNAARRREVNVASARNWRQLVRSSPTATRSPNFQVWRYDLADVRLRGSFC
jgi:hypothetical protein